MSRKYIFILLLVSLVTASLACSLAENLVGGDADIQKNLQLTISKLTRQRMLKMSAPVEAGGKDEPGTTDNEVVEDSGSRSE